MEYFYKAGCVKKRWLYWKAPIFVTQNCIIFLTSLPVSEVTPWFISDNIPAPAQLQPSSSPGTNKRLVSQQKYFHPQSAWVRDISVRRCQFHWWIDTVGPASSGSVSISQRTSQYCEATPASADISSDQWSYYRMAPILLSHPNATCNMQGKQGQVVKNYSLSR